MLVGKQTEQQRLAVESGAESGTLGAALKVKAAGAFAQVEQDAVQTRTPEHAVGGGATIPGSRGGCVGEEFKIAEMTDGHNPADDFFGFGFRGDFFHAEELHVVAQT